MLNIEYRKATYSLSFELPFKVYDSVSKSNLLVDKLRDAKFGGHLTNDVYLGTKRISITIHDTNKSLEDVQKQINQIYDSVVNPVKTTTKTKGKIAQEVV